MKPTTIETLAGVIKDATGPVAIQGGGTRLDVPPQGAVLSTAGLSGIVLYDPGALTMVARAGTPLAEIEEALSAEGQRLAFEPMDLRGIMGREGTPTIGGVVATNASGPGRIHAGACRDALLGMTFVDGAGTIVKNGGRVMKNVTGYDLVKLLAGSYGTLGVIAEVAFKVLPAPQTQATVRISGLNDGQAVAAMARALGSPYEISGAAHWERDGVHEALLRLEGFSDSVAYRVGAVKDLFDGAEIDDDPKTVAQQWRDLRDVVPFHGKEGNLWRIAVTPSRAAAVAAALRAEFGAELMFDWGGGLIWALVAPSHSPRALPGVGHATLVRGQGHARWHPQPARLAQAAAQLRAKFDPKGILNPGMMD